MSEDHAIGRFPVSPFLRFSVSLPPSARLPLASVFFTVAAMAGFTIAQALIEASQLLRKGGVPDPRREAASFLAHVIGRDRTFLITRAETELSVSEVKRLRDFIERRAGGEPMQYILGHQEFFNLDFEVAPGVLIPRSETEILVEKALSLLDAGSDATVCDVGTGSGCIIISLLHERPRARGLALDISSDAIEIATRNALRLGVSDRLELLQSDCFSAVNGGDRFDLMVSNPPYVRESALETLQREVREYEPAEALTSGADGLDMIRRLLVDGWSHLTEGGYFLFEMGFDQNDSVRSLIAQSGWTLVEIIDDLQGIPRIVVLKKL
jgi:release factor glutamine methyltransferase